MFVQEGGATRVRVLAGLLSPLKFGWKVPSFVLPVCCWLRRSGLVKTVGIYYYLGKPFCVGQMGGIISLVIHMNWTLYGSVTWMIGYLGSKILRAGAGMKEGMEKEPYPALTQVYLHLIFFGGEGRLFTFPGSEFGGWTSLWLSIFMYTILLKLWFSSALDGRKQILENWTLRMIHPIGQMGLLHPWLMGVSAWTSCTGFCFQSSS